MLELLARIRNTMLDLRLTIGRRADYYAVVMWERQSLESWQSWGVFANATYDRDSRMWYLTISAHSMRQAERIGRGFVNMLESEFDTAAVYRVEIYP